MVRVLAGVASVCRFSQKGRVSRLNPDGGLVYGCWQVRWMVGVFLCGCGPLFETGGELVFFQNTARCFLFEMDLVAGGKAAWVIDLQSFPPNHRHCPGTRTGIALG